jgi:hypothetical protein
MNSRLPERDAFASPFDLAKHDRVIILGDRTFSVRAYFDRRSPGGPGWHATIIENRTPVDHALAPTDSPEECLAAVGRFLSARFDTDSAERRSPPP